MGRYIFSLRFSFPLFFLVFSCIHLFEAVESYEDTNKSLTKNAQEKLDLALALKIESLESSLDELKGGELPAAALADKMRDKVENFTFPDGIVLLVEPPSTVLLATDGITSDDLNPIFLKKSMLRKADSIELNLDGQSYFGRYRNFKDFDFALILAVRKQAILKDLSELESHLIMDVLINLSLLALIVLFFHWRVIGPINKMVRAMHKTGEGEVQKIRRHKFNDEMGILVSAFNLMVDRVAKAQEELLSKTEEEMRSNKLAQDESAFSQGILQSIPDMVFVLDKNLKVTLTNEKAESNLEYTTEELKGGLFRNFFVSPWNTFDKVFEEYPTETIHIADLKLRRKDDSTIPVFLSLSRLPETHNLDRGRYVAIIKDVSEMKVYQERDQAKSQMVQSAKMAALEKWPGVLPMR